MGEPRTWERVAGGVLVALLAAVLALLECFYVNLRAGTAPVPIAQVAAFGLNLALPRLMVRATGRRGSAIVPALLWVVLAFVLAASGPGGDVVVPGNWQGVTLLLAGAAGAVVGVVTVLPPAGRRPAGSVPSAVRSRGGQRR